MIQAPEDVANLVMNEMKYLEREHFRAIFLNTKNYVIGIDTISIGFLDSSLIHPREIFRNAIRHCAADIILLHNHPSGNPTPSKEDIEVTARLVESGNLLGIQILDHIIIGDGKFVSLKSKGLI